MALLLVVACRWLGRVVPIAGIVVGWHLHRWPGAIVGALIACPVAILLWLVTRWMVHRVWMRRGRDEVAAFSTDRLREIVADPTSPNLAFAMWELADRGVVGVRPSVESLFDLLTSPHHGRRRLAMTLLFTFYPAVHAKLPLDCSSTDSPEQWQERVASLRAAQ